MGGKVKRAGRNADVDATTPAPGNVGKKSSGKKRNKGKAAPKEMTSNHSREADRAEEDQIGNIDGAKEGTTEDVVEKQKKSTSYQNEEGGEVKQYILREKDEAEMEEGLEDKGDKGAANEGGVADGSGGAPNEAGEDEDGERFAKLVGVGEGWEDSDDEGAMETVAIGLLPGQVISDARNDEAGLERKLEEIGIFYGEEALPFHESLTVTMPLNEKLGDKLAMDDLKRERRFAELATEAVHKGLERLREERVKFRRPGDYFAQMVKSDAQMAKVKDKLLYEKGKIEGAEKRRNNREIAKNRKKVRATQMEREQEKKRKAKEEIEALSQLRKQRLKDREQVGVEGEDDEDEFPIDLLGIEQLDEENRFRPQKEIAEGKRKAWSAKKDVGDSRNANKPGEKRGKGRDITNRPRVGRANRPSDGRVQKAKQGSRGKKKRLGKSRRAAAKGKNG